MDYADIANGLDFLSHGRGSLYSPSRRYKRQIARDHNVGILCGMLQPENSKPLSSLISRQDSYIARQAIRNDKIHHRAQPRFSWPKEKNLGWRISANISIDSTTRGPGRLK